MAIRKLRRPAISLSCTQMKMSDPASCLIVGSGDPSIKKASRVSQEACRKAHLQAARSGSRSRQAAWNLSDDRRQTPADYLVAAAGLAATTLPAQQAKRLLAATQFATARLGTAAGGARGAAARGRSNTWGGSAWCRGNTGGRSTRCWCTGSRSRTRGGATANLANLDDSCDLVHFALWAAGWLSSRTAT